MNNQFVLKLPCEVEGNILKYTIKLGDETITDELNKSGLNGYNPDKIMMEKIYSANKGLAKVSGQRSLRGLLEESHHLGLERRNFKVAV